MRPRPVLLLALLALVPSVAGAQATVPCEVSRIVDGDTLYCRDGTKVRLLGIDSPERGQGAVAREATAALARLAPVGDTVALETDVRSHDRYGRLLAHVWRHDTLVNEALVAGGWAVLYTVPPNVKHVERLTSAERQARRRGVGLWAPGALACSPAVFRRGDCPRQ